ncbi:2-keto-4-pentenoate hydratase [Granulicella arctica]|uniref:2-keto-4-pentenoate hydratase n=1 Tax=Granulicella arctica TaxID=940613 RepID=UPI0021E09FFF|nr:2-keto-4-pentenoate hydratase [Granulicella arctica]
MNNGARELQLTDAINALLDARRTNTPLTDLPVEWQPTTLDEAYFVQDAMAVAYGEIGGWKVGSPTADGTPIFAPMPRNWIAPAAAVLSEQTHRYRGLEAEIAFMMGEDLPPRATPYTREEVVAAIESCHPAIEVLESGLVDPAAAARMSMLADLQMHGGFVYGPACPEWKSIDFTKETVTLAVDGLIRVERTGSNTSGDLMRLLPWLANEGAVRTGGLKAGQWVTTGSWTGNVQAISGASVDVTFVHAGRVGLRFA